MGTSSVFSITSFKAKKGDKKEMAWKILRRALILFGLGVWGNNGHDYYHWRIPSVLGRFGVSYLVVATLQAFVPECNINVSGRLAAVRDIVKHLWEWLIITAIAFVWLMITFFLDVPGCGRGYIGPGGTGDYGEFPLCTGGAAGYIDRIILGESHIYKFPTCQDVYHTGPYDPEGILGYLTSICMTYLGAQAGRIIVYYGKDDKAVMKRWLCWGVGLGLIALALTGGAQQNGFGIPINKNLWSLSFIIALSSMGFILLTAFYFIIDVLQWYDGTPFIYPGLNSILVYEGHGLFQHLFPFSYVLPNDNTHEPMLIEHLVGTACMILLSYWCFVNDFFINV